MYTFDKGGPGEIWSDMCHYAQTVTLPHGVIKASGQGGWDAARASDPEDPAKQIANALENVDRVLQEAGLRGWEDVYCLRSYHCGIDRTHQLLADALKQRIPSHRPIWTAVGVASLADPNMLIELEVEAVKQQI